MLIDSAYRSPEVVSVAFIYITS